MKWPNTQTLIRHAESDYNKMAEAKKSDPRYQEFAEAYDDPDSDPKVVRAMAQAIHDSGMLQPGIADHNTPISERGHEQAFATGKRLPEHIKLPDIIIASPYLRIEQTIGAMVLGWPELGTVPVKKDRRVREQEHGLQTVYGDWRVYQTLFPEQRTLRELQGSYWFRYQQGENVPDVRERWQSIQTKIVRDYAEKDIMIVTHHLTILSARANQEDLDEDEFIRLDHEEKPVNCGVTIYRGNPSAGSDGRLELEIYNKQLWQPSDLTERPS